jgi:gliding motility-associated-like protein
LNLNTLVTGSAGGLWSETTIPASGSFNTITGVFTTAGLTAGVYTFDYWVNAVAPCVPDMASFTVTVSDLPNAGPDNATSLCNIAGTTSDLDVLIAGDPGGIWSEVTSSGGFTPATGLLDASGVTAGTYTFNYDIPAAGPCPADQAVITVTIEQEAVAGPDNTYQLCNTAGTTLDLDLMLVGAGAGTWAETSATPSGAFTPGTGVLNAAGVAAGVYTFEYTVAAVAPCVPDVAVMTITIQQEVNAGADNTTQECNYTGSIVNLNTLLSGADAGGVWAETTSSGAFVPATGVLSLTGLAAGVYDFTYSMTGVAPCPSDVANFTVTVDAFPTITPLLDEEMCDGDNHITQLFNADVPGTTFSWDNTTGTDVGFGLSGTGNIGGYTGTTGSTSDVTVVIEVTPSTAAGCVGPVETFNVAVHPTPVVVFTADDLSGCSPLQVTFNSLTPGGDVCEWTFGDGSTGSGCGSVSNVFEIEGTYDVGLTVTTTYGCSGSAMYADYITVTPVASAKFNYSPNMITIDDTKVIFTNTSVDADTYTWDFGDASPLSNEENPTHEFPELGGGEYLVTLWADNAGGCPDSTQVLIKVEDIILFFIPNTFTPDGNGYNDDFRPIMTAGFDIYDFHFTIFNRWGEIVFESYNSTGGWNGTYGDRGIVEDGTYVWTLEFGETMSDKKHRHRGHVTILK